MNGQLARLASRGGVWLRLIASVMLVVSLVVVPSAEPASAFPAPVQIFYVTLPESDGLRVLDGVRVDADTPMWTYFSIAIGVTGTYVYYDQWEDGYAGTINNPTGAEIYNSATNPDGVQIWGNGVAADGCAPNIAGTPVTCTDGNDVLNAGDVIIPYNSVALTGYGATTVLDQFGTVAYSNNNGTTTWNGNWIETGDFLLDNYRDQFDTVAYNNTNGTLTWSTSWVEVGDDVNPATGYTLITGGALRFDRYSALNDAISRAVDLSAYSSATLSFTLDGNSIDGINDAIAVQISSDGGSNWTTLGTFSSDTNGATQTYTLTDAQTTANSVVRFIMTGNDLRDSGEYWAIDNVDISVAAGGGTSPSQGDIQIISTALRFTETEANDSIDRGVTLPAGGDCAFLTFQLGQTGIDDNEDKLAVQLSADGGATYTTIDTYEFASEGGGATATGNKWYNIAAFATNTRVRFVSLDQLETGEYWSIDNVQVAWGCAVGDAGAVLFDGRDKIGATSSIAMARATWATGSGTLNAFGHEMYATADWGTYYEAPVGMNTAPAGAGQMFELANLSIMASQDNTTVQIDADADGAVDSSFVLNQGGSRLTRNILQGARVQADKPVQVLLVTGDVGSGYASRDMNLLPTSAWGSSYWSPVGVINTTSYPTRLFLYNLSTNGSIYITCEKYGAANVTSPLVAPGGVYTTDLTAGMGARCYASDAAGVATADKIFAIGTVDTTNTAYDWSFTLFPDNFLSTEALVGLGLGKDPTDTTSTENGSPLWVTAACSTGLTYVYVDWNNDGTADSVDTDGDDVGDANPVTVNRLQSVRMFEPGADEEEYDQSGARVWSCASNASPVRANCTTPGCPLALAWGEDPGNATAGSPGLDVGTSVAPLKPIEGTKSLTFADDTAPAGGVLNPGDRVYYNITVKNAGTTIITNVYVYDTVPANTTYVAVSTEYSTNGTTWTPIADVGGGLPLAQVGGWLYGNLNPGVTLYVRFQVTLNTGIYTELNNCDTVSSSAGTFERCVTSPVAAYDWGDLPDSYQTSSAATGAWHSNNGLKLGSLWDYETQGVPSSDAQGDDQATSDDEDGVTLAGTFAQWNAGSGSFNVTASGSGCLNAWMDFTNNSGQVPTAGGGYYADTNFYNGLAYDSGGGKSEHIIQNYAVSAGSQIVPVSVPPYLGQLIGNKYYVRFRLTPAPCTTVQPYGGASGGEVEDYRFTLDDPTSANLISFEATGGQSEVTIQWQTSNELNNVGFNVYRSKTLESKRSLLNAELIPTRVNPGSSGGALYEFIDENAPVALQYYYWLEMVDASGTTTLHGPISAGLR